MRGREVRSTPNRNGRQRSTERCWGRRRPRIAGPLSKKKIRERPYPRLCLAELRLQTAPGPQGHTRSWQTTSTEQSSSLKSVLALRFVLVVSTDHDRDP